MKRRGKFYSTLASLAIIPSLFGCEAGSKPDFLGEYNSVFEKATAMLKAERNLPNQDLIQTGSLPMYENPFEIVKGGAYDWIVYNSRYQNSNDLKTILEEHLSEITDKITISGSQIVMRIPNSEDRMSNESIENLISKVDTLPQKIMVDVRAVRVFSDYTQDIRNMLKTLYKGESEFIPSADIILPGAELRVAERAEFGAEYTIIGTLGKYALQIMLDTLVSAGFAEDMAISTLVLDSMKSGRINLQDEIPYEEDVNIGGGVFRPTTRFKPAPNFLDITPEARDDGYVFLKLSAGVSTLRPFGPAQIPTITLREVRIDGITIKERKTYVVAGFTDKRKSAVKRKAPPFSDLPLLGKLISSEDLEMSNNTIYFIITPYYLRDKETEPEALKAESW